MQARNADNRGYGAHNFFIRELKCFLKTEEGKVSVGVFVGKNGSGGLAGLRSPSIAYALPVVA